MGDALVVVLLFAAASIGVLILSDRRSQRKGAAGSGGGDMTVGVFILLGALLGTVLGLMFRPSFPLLGQLPLSTVITRGANLAGLDVILKSAAEESFNYMALGTVVGAGAGALFGTLRRSSSVSASVPTPSQKFTFCPKCGAAFREEAEFCGVCGGRR